VVPCLILLAFEDPDIRLMSVPGSSRSVMEAGSTGKFVVGLPQNLSERQKARELIKTNASRHRWRTPGVQAKKKSVKSMQTRDRQSVRPTTAMSCSLLRHYKVCPPKRNACRWSFQHDGGPCTDDVFSIVGADQFTNSLHYRTPRQPFRY
jgi:hypothetical protein